MKKYIKPLMKNEVFRSNDFVAACYKIKCTTPNNNAYFNYLYDDTNNSGELDTGDTRLYYSNGFKGCNKWHIGVIQDEAPTANGFVSTKKVNSKSNTIKEVYWWSEDLGSTSDYHVMTPGSQNYESNPNAS